MHDSPFGPPPSGVPGMCMISSTHPQRRDVPRAACYLPLRQNFNQSLPGDVCQLFTATTCPRMSSRHRHHGNADPQPPLRSSAVLPLNWSHRKIHNFSFFINRVADSPLAGSLTCPLGNLLLLQMASLLLTLSQTQTSWPGVSLQEKE